MSTPVASFDGDTLYLDTMIPYVLLRGIDPRARSFFNNVERDRYTVYTSVLTFDELAYRLLLALIRDHYSGSPIEVLRDQEEKLIAEFYPRLAPQLARLRALPSLHLVDVTAADLDVMDEGMLKYGLRPRDALHWAAMQKCGCFDLMSQDSDFDRIPELRRYTL